MPKQNRSVIISFRLTPREAARIKRLAKKNAASLSEWIVATLLAAPEERT